MCSIIIEDFNKKINVRQKRKNITTVHVCKTHDILKTHLMKFPYILKKNDIVIKEFHKSKLKI